MASAAPSTVPNGAKPESRTGASRPDDPDFQAAESLLFLFSGTSPVTEAPPGAEVNTSTVSNRTPSDSTPPPVLPIPSTIADTKLHEAKPPQILSNNSTQFAEPRNVQIQAEFNGVRETRTLDHSVPIQSPTKPEPIERNSFAHGPPEYRLHPTEPHAFDGSHHFRPGSNGTSATMRHGPGLSPPPSLSYSHQNELRSVTLPPIIPSPTRNLSQSLPSNNELFVAFNDIRSRTLPPIESDLSLQSPNRRASFPPPSAAEGARYTRVEDDMPTVNMPAYRPLRLPPTLPPPQLSPFNGYHIANGLNGTNESSFNRSPVQAEQMQLPRATSYEPRPYGRVNTNINGSHNHQRNISNGGQPLNGVLATTVDNPKRSSMNGTRSPSKSQNKKRQTSGTPPKDAQFAPLNGPPKKAQKAMKEKQKEKRTPLPLTLVHSLQSAVNVKSETIVEPLAKENTLAPALDNSKKAAAENIIADARATSPAHTSDSQETCAICHQMDVPDDKGSVYLWIECDGCNRWFHVKCFCELTRYPLFDPEDVAKFYCDDCPGKVVFKRKSAREKTAIDYSALNEGDSVPARTSESKTHHWVNKYFLTNEQWADKPVETFPRMDAKLVTVEFFEQPEYGFKEPIVITKDANRRPWHMSRDQLSEEQSSSGRDDLGMKIPEGFSVDMVADELLKEPKPTTVEVLNVKNQSKLATWLIEDWRRYYNTPDEEREKILNVISLEVTNTKFASQFRRPRLTEQLDLMQFWQPGEDLPAPVKNYILMSVKDSYTDFHVDFGGSAVFYHIVKGAKTFVFIRPTEHNIRAYTNWNNGKNQNHVWLPDDCDEFVYKVELQAGDTMFIPPGWIHSVFTPLDSLVYGGNFLTYLNYPMHNKIWQVEKDTKVSEKHKYPRYAKVMWMTAINYIESDPLPKTGPLEHPLPEDQQIVLAQAELPVPAHRKYSVHELNGLASLRDYLFRNCMIGLGKHDFSPNVAKKCLESVPTSHRSRSFETLVEFSRWVEQKTGQAAPEWTSANIEDLDFRAKAPKALSKAKLERVEREMLSKTIHELGLTRKSDRSTTRKRSLASAELGEMPSNGASMSPPAEDKEGAPKKVKVSHEPERRESNVSAKSEGEIRLPTPRASSPNKRKASTPAPADPRHKSVSNLEDDDEPPVKRSRSESPDYEGTPEYHDYSSDEERSESPLESKGEGNSPRKLENGKTRKRIGRPRSDSGKGRPSGPARTACDMCRRAHRSCPHKKEIASGSKSDTERDSKQPRKAKGKGTACVECKRRKKRCDGSNCGQSGNSPEPETPDNKQMLETLLKEEFSLRKRS